MAPMLTWFSRQFGLCSNRHYIMSHTLPASYFVLHICMLYMHTFIYVCCKCIQLALTDPFESSAELKNQSDDLIYWHMKSTIINTGYTLYNFNIRTKWQWYIIPPPPNKLFSDISVTLRTFLNISLSLISFSFQLFPITSIHLVHNECRQQAHTYG